MPQSSVPSRDGGFMSRLRQFANLQPGETLPLFVFILLLAVNSIALEGSYILSTSGFLKELSVTQFPRLWVVDMALILVVSSLFGLVVDRVPRLRLVGGIVLLLACVSLLFRFLLARNAPDWLTYPGLYLVAEQQYVVFPLAFWALANDRFSVAQAKRLFPLIAAGGLIGQIIGGSLAAFSVQIFASWGMAGYELLTLNALLFLLTFFFLMITARHLAVASVRQSMSHIALRDSVTTGWDFVANVPAVGYLALVMLGTGFVLVLIEFHFLVTADVAFATAATFQTFYGIYRVALTLSILVMQSTFTGRFLQRYGLRDAFFPGPISLIAGVVSMLLFPGIVGGAMGRFIARLFQESSTKPANQAFFGLVPEERRGRVSTFMSSYLYVFGNMAGSLLLILVTAIAVARQIEGTLLYLVPALAVAVLTLYWMLRLRQSYAESLLNWRFTRRRRRTSAKLDDLLGALD